MIGFCGLSHLGTVSSIAAAAKGHQVLGYDPDPSVYAQLSQGELPVHEPGLAALLEENRQNIAFSNHLSDLKKCSLVYIAKDIPTNDDNQSDPSSVIALLDDLSQTLDAQVPVVILSQVSPGFTAKMQAKFANLNLYYQVETLVFGDAVNRATNPERFIVGLPPASGQLPAVMADYLASFDCPIVPMSLTSAELTKIAINCFLVSTVSTTNMLAELCEELGADWSQMVPALQLDRRIGPHAYLKPGLGIAGGNLERDLQTILNLSSHHDTESGVVKAWLASSSYRKAAVQRVLKDHVLPTQEQPTIGVLGIAYKQGTHSIKNSPAVAFLRDFKEHKLNAYDPEAKLPSDLEGVVPCSPTLAGVLQGADVLAIMTPWPEFAALTPATLAAAMRGRIIIDPYGVLADKAFDASWQYFTLGSRPNR